MERILSIKSAEGGMDSQIFVGELAKSYEKLFTKKGWSFR